MVTLPANSGLMVRHIVDVDVDAAVIFVADTGNTGTAGFYGIQRAFVQALETTSVALSSLRLQPVHLGVVKFNQLVFQASEFWVVANREFRRQRSLVAVECRRLSVGVSCGKRQSETKEARSDKVFDIHGPISRVVQLRSPLGMKFKSRPMNQTGTRDLSPVHVHTLPCGIV